MKKSCLAALFVYYAVIKVPAFPLAASLEAVMEVIKTLPVGFFSRVENGSFYFG
jgi:hypothetical protein